MYVALPAADSPMHTGDEVEQCVNRLVKLVRVLVNQSRAIFEEITIACSKSGEWYKPNLGEC